MWPKRASLRRSAVSEIDRCLRACMLYKQPVYIQVPSDIVYLKITTPKTPLVVEFPSDVDMVEDFAAAALSQIASAASVAILADADVSRFGHADKVLKLAERLSWPVRRHGDGQRVSSMKPIRIMWACIRAPPPRLPRVRPSNLQNV